MTVSANSNLPDMFLSHPSDAKLTVPAAHAPSSGKRHFRNLSDEEDRRCMMISGPSSQTSIIFTKGPYAGFKNAGAPQTSCSQHLNMYSLNDAAGLRSTIRLLPDVVASFTSEAFIREGNCRLLITPAPQRQAFKKKLVSLPTTGSGAGAHPQPLHTIRFT